jgi:hypothetical protein
MLDKDHSGYLDAKDLENCGDDMNELKQKLLD